MKNLVMRSFRSFGSLVVLALLVLMLFPSWALAADGAPPTAVENFYQQVMNILVPVFVAFIGTLASWALVKIKTKLHLEVSDKTMTQWKELAQSAAYRGAEWARAKGKTLVEGKKIPGGEVMDVAANWALQMAEQQKLPVLAREKLIGLIESELFKIRQAEALTVQGMAASVPGATPDLSKLPAT